MHLLPKHTLTLVIYIISPLWHCYFCMIFDKICLPMFKNIVSCTTSTVYIRKNTKKYTESAKAQITLYALDNFSITLFEVMTCFFSPEGCLEGQRYTCKLLWCTLNPLYERIVWELGKCIWETNRILLHRQDADNFWCIKEWSHAQRIKIWNEIPR